jgi:ABC-2 type transport system ATP-binding protein
MFMAEPTCVLSHQGRGANQNLPESRDSGASHIVAVTGITKRYAHHTAVENLTLALRPGEVFGLVGANGGGKTTTLRILAGILTPDRGHGCVLGFDLLRSAGEIRRHVGYMSQRLSLYADLSVFENLRFRAQVYGLHKPRAEAEAAIDNFGLTAYGRSAAAQLSGGWARRLQLAAALIHSPQLVLLDEPTAGLDAVSRQEVWQRIEHMAAQGAGVIVSTHDLAEAERCSRIACLSEGQVVAVGLPEQVAQSASAAAFLLSGGDTHLLAQSIDAVPGVIASYPQGSNLRVVAEEKAETGLKRVANMHNRGLTRVAMRLEDAALVFSRRSLRSRA